MMPKIFAMRRYIEQHLETVRRQGGQGLIAEIVRVERDGGKISRAAEELGISRPTLYELMEKLSLAKPNQEKKESS